MFDINKEKKQIILHYYVVVYNPRNKQAFADLKYHGGWDIVLKEDDWEVSHRYIGLDTLDYRFWWHA